MLRLKDGFVAVAIREFDLDGAVVEQFGGPVALDLIRFLDDRCVAPQRLVRKTPAIR